MFVRKPELLVEVSVPSLSLSPFADIVFFIFLYQRWIYRVDLKRVNEYGTSGEENEEDNVCKGREKRLEELHQKLWFSHKHFCYTAVAVMETICKHLSLYGTA